MQSRVDSIGKITKVGFYRLIIGGGTIFILLLALAAFFYSKTKIDASHNQARDIVEAYSQRIIAVRLQGNLDTMGMILEAMNARIPGLTFGYAFPGSTRNDEGVFTGRIPIEYGQERYGSVTYDISWSRVLNWPELLFGLALAVGFFLILVYNYRFTRNMFQIKILEPLSYLSRTLSETSSMRDLAKISPPHSASREIRIAFQSIAAFATENLKAREQIRQTEYREAISKATSFLAHDIRNPLNLIGMTLDTLQHTNDAAAIKTIINDSAPGIKGATEHALELLECMIDAGSERKLHQADCALADLVDAAFRRTALNWQNKNVTFSYDFDPTVTLFVDRIKIVRVLSNIFSNAAKAIDGRAEVWIRNDPQMEQSGFARIAIGNSGSGLSPTECNRVFELFFTKDRENGCGLGLAVVKTIVERHEGTIQCDSDGATWVEFVIALPLGRSIAKPMALLPLSPLDLLAPSSLENMRPVPIKTVSDLRILLVDDDQEYSAALKANLSSQGRTAQPMIELSAVTTYDEAISSVPRIKPNVILLDIDLGPDSQGNGLAVARELRRQGCLSYICLHSSRDDIGDSEMSELGINEFIAKPMDARKFSGLLDRCERFSTTK